MGKIMRHSWQYPPELATKLATLIIKEYPRGIAIEELNELPSGDARNRLSTYSSSFDYAARGHSEEHMQKYENAIRALENYNLDAIAEVYRAYFGYGPAMGGSISVEKGRKLWGVT